VRTAEDEVKGHTWASRDEAVGDLIDKSGAQVVALQEAGANLGKTITAPGQYDIHWQFEDVDEHADSKYALVNSDEYSLASNGGKEGTRILYDTTVLRVVESGFFAPSAVNKYLRWVPWALFENTTTGERFYFISAHLDNRKDTGKSHTFYDLRIKQILSVITKAREFRATGNQVVLAGDLNSNIYSPPKNGVDRKLLAAGFYDAYATTNLTYPFRVTYNGFAASKKSASRTDYIFTFGRSDLRGSFAYKDWIKKENGVYASDHNMQTAVVPY
jgi:endonuclease/exonuclease/phosphatase family metal-dependent hydrolase